MSDLPYFLAPTPLILPDEAPDLKAVLEGLKARALHGGFNYAVRGKQRKTKVFVVCSNRQCSHSLVLRKPIGRKHRWSLEVIHPAHNHEPMTSLGSGHVPMYIIRKVLEHVPDGEWNAGRVRDIVAQEISIKLGSAGLGGIRTRWLKHNGHDKPRKAKTENTPLQELVRNALEYTDRRVIDPDSKPSRHSRRYLTDRPPLSVIPVNVDSKPTLAALRTPPASLSLPGPSSAPASGVTQADLPLPSPVRSWAEIVGIKPEISRAGNVPQATLETVCETTLETHHVQTQLHTTQSQLTEHATPLAKHDTTIAHLRAQFSRFGFDHNIQTGVTVPEL